MICENLPLDMLLNGTRKNDFLKILTLEHKSLGGVLMSDADNILLNDRTCIKLRGNIVACSTDDLHTTLISLMIRLCSYERRKE